MANSPKIGRLLDSLADEFEKEWRGGARPQIEDFLTRMPASVRKTLLRELLLVELQLCRNAGMPASRTDYLERFHAHGTLVSSVFDDDERRVSLPSHADTNTFCRSSNGDTAPTTIQETQFTSQSMRLPRTFGDFELLEEIGIGGMGVVYKAHQKSADRIVALKLIRPDRISNFLPKDRQRVLARFRNEVTAAAKLDHDHVVTIYNVGEIDGQAYYAMRYVEGVSLSDMLKQGPLEPLDAARYIEHVANGLAEAHSIGILHRDLKPHNVMIDQKHDRALLADFGLAKLIQGEQHLTTSEVVFGSPPYMSPEQTRDSGKVTAASDIYGLGATLYHLLAGRPPFQAANPTATMIQVQEVDPVSPRELNAAVARDLETICLKCLDKEPARRYESANTVAVELNRFLNGLPIQARPVSGIEWAWRWCKRNPVVAGLSLGIATVLLVGIVTSMVLGTVAWRKANDATVANQALTVKQSQLVSANVELETNAAALKSANSDLMATAERLTSALSEVSEQRRKAEREEKLAKIRLYAATIASAQRAWEQGDISVARRHLESCDLEQRGWEHDYLYALINRGMLEGHSAATKGVAFSPDDHHFVSCSLDKTLKVWNVTGDDVPLTLAGHEGWVTCAAYSPDGKWIASGGSDMALRLWDAASGKQLVTLAGHMAWITDLAFSPDGKRIVSSSSDTTLKVWDIAESKDILTLEGHKGAVTCVAYDPQGQRIVSGSADGMLKLWDATTGMLLGEDLEFGGSVDDVAFSPDGSRIVCDDGNNPALKVCNIETRDVTLTLRGHTGWITCLEFSPDGQRIASGSYDTTVKVWDAATGDELRTFSGHTGVVTSLSFSKNGRRIVSGSNDKTLRVWDDASDSVLNMPRTIAGSFRCVACTPQGSKIVTGTADSKLTVWNAASLEAISEWVIGGGPINCLAVSSDGRLIVAGVADHSLVVWDADLGEKITTLTGHNKRVSSVSFSPNGQWIVTGSYDESARVWNIASGQEMLSFKAHADGITAVEFSPNSQRIVSGSQDGALKVWDAKTGELQMTLAGHSQGVSSVAFSRDGMWIASGSYDRTIRIWNAATGESLMTLEGHTNGVRSIAISPDGERLASGSLDNTVKLWDTKTGQHTVTLKGHTDGIFGVHMTDEGRRIVTCSFDKKLKVWDAIDERFALQGYSATVDESPSGLSIEPQ